MIEEHVNQEILDSYTFLRGQGYTYREAVTIVADDYLSEEEDVIEILNKSDLFGEEDDE